MKTKIQTLLLSSTLGIALISCHEPEVKTPVNQTETVKTEIIDFKGEAAVVPARFPKQLFDQSTEEFIAYYKNFAKNNKGNGEQEMGVLSYDDLKIVFEKCTGRYPKITLDNIISENDLKRIFSDFPKLKNKDEVDSKRLIIYDYYQDLCKYDIAVEIVTGKGYERHLRTLGSPGTPTQEEQAHLNSNPGFAVGYINAALEANFFTQSQYGNLNDNTEGNAFRHSCWNAFSIKNILNSTPASENQAIDFTQDGTSKHEITENGIQYTIAAAMDLHNNMSARVWMEKKTSWGIGPLRKTPSYVDIMDAMHLFASQATFYNRLVDPNGAFSSILNLHNANHATAWNNLYNNMYGPYQHLVRTE